MSSLKKKSLFILMAMIVLVLVPMSFASDVDNELAVNGTADVASVADDIDEISVDDADDSNQAAEVESDDELSSTPIPDDGAFVYMGTDSATIDDGESVTISGNIRYSYGGGGSDSLQAAFPITCTYTDVNGDVKEYSFTATSGGLFNFNTASFEGLSGRAAPYSLVISAVDTGNNDALYTTGSSTIKSATYTLTINPPAAPTTGTATDIQNKLDDTSLTTIDLSDFDSYDVGNTTFEVARAVTIIGNGNTVINGWGGPGNGIFHVSASGVTFRGIIFNCTNPDSLLTYYDENTNKANEVKGWGIHFQRATNGLVDACAFLNFNSPVRIQQQANDVTVKNSYFTGVTNYLRNDPLVNVERGTKAVNVMGSQNTQIINNTFEGPVLDAISLASGCGGASIINNTFIGNSYAIYFGGASTAGTTISGNKFKNVGHFEGTDSKTGNPVVWDLLPIISIQKSASGIQITDNEFEAIAGNILIAAEAGNTAHGGPSALGNVVVTGNKIADNAYASSATLLHILARGGDFNPFEAVTVENNTLSGAKSIAYWNNEWGDEYGNAEIPKGDLSVSIIKITGIAGNVITAELVDGDGVAVDGATIAYTIDGGANGTVETDENGVFTVTGEEGKSIKIDFLETAVFAGDSVNITLPATPEPVVVKPVATTVTASNVAIKAGNSGTLKAIFKDINGNLLAGQEVSVEVDGEPLFIGKTDAKGAISVPVKYASATTKYAVITYINEDGKYLSSFETVKITVTKKATTLTAKKATLKVKKVKKVKVTLKSEGKALAKKTVTIKVNGKTFKAKTNAKGVATIKVKVAKKGKFTATVKFAGDGAYKAITKKVKFTVKK